MGEWIIWKRTRGNPGSVQISGNEMVSYLGHRVMHAWGYAGVEQLSIAHDLMSWGFNGRYGVGGVGTVAVTFPAYTPSGVIRDRTYKELDGDIGARVKELSDVDNGFDYLVIPSITLTGTAMVIRTVRFYYPRAGISQPFVFEMAGGLDSPGIGNALATSVAEDASTLASWAYATGANAGDTALTGFTYNPALITAGYPLFERVVSFSNVTTQSVIDSHALAVWNDAQTSELPESLDVLADGVPGLGDYALGDRVTLVIESSTNFPDGFTGAVRIIGWTLKPPDSGPEIVSLKITKE